jgi:hypothetical protein
VYRAGYENILPISKSNDPVRYVADTQDSMINVRKPICDCSFKFRARIISHRTATTYNIEANEYIDAPKIYAVLTLVVSSTMNPNGRYARAPKM